MSLETGFISDFFFAASFFGAGFLASFAGIGSGAGFLISTGLGAGFLASTGFGVGFLTSAGTGVGVVVPGL